MRSDHRERLEALARTVSLIVETARQQQITFLAAAVTYYMLVSLVPLLALALAVGTGIWGDQAVEWLLGWTDELMTTDAQELLSEALVEGRGRVGATVVSTLVVFWSGLRVFRGIDKAFAQVYGTAGEKSILQELRDGVLVLVSIGGAMTAMTVVSVLLSLLPLGPLTGPLARLLLTVSLAAIFLPVYYVFPAQELDLTAAVPGAIVAAVGWTILGAFFGGYLAIAGTVGVYGPLGGLLLLVTLLYAGAIVLLLGTVVNAVLDDEVRIGKYNRADL